MKTFLGSLFGIFRRIQPDLVISYTVKPVVYGSLAAYAARVPKRVSLITGVGYAFTSDTFKAKVTRLVQSVLYKVSLATNQALFFYNRDHLEDFTRLRLISRRSLVQIVNGSGVDIDLFSFVPPPLGSTSFLMIARLLRDKGIFEYVEAARSLRRKYSNVVFRLVGFLDPNPSGITAETVAAWSREGVVEYLGEATDVRPHLAACSVYVLPSYAEGTPRSVLEAMATGRPIVTTDAPGCRETVSTGVNGFLVPPRNPEALARAMERFILEPQLITRFGEASRRIAETKYDAREVASQILAALQLENGAPHIQGA
jgi:glycosyltransferase involved in cell wall biosynthesis